MDVGPARSFPDHAAESAPSGAACSCRRKDRATARQAHRGRPREPSTISSNGRLQPLGQPRRTSRLIHGASTSRQRASLSGGWIAERRLGLEASDDTIAPNIGRDLARSVGVGATASVAACGKIIVLGRSSGWSTRQARLPTTQRGRISRGRCRRTQPCRQRPANEATCPLVVSDKTGGGTASALR